MKPPSLVLPINLEISLRCSSSLRCAEARGWSTFLLCTRDMDSVEPHFSIFDVCVSVNKSRVPGPKDLTSVPCSTKVHPRTRLQCGSRGAPLRFCATSLRPFSRAMRTPYAQVTLCFDSPNHPWVPRDPVDVHLEMQMGSSQSSRLSRRSRLSVHADLLALGNTQRDWCAYIVTKPPP